MKLTARQRATYLAHLYKAIFKGYHAQLVPYLARIIAEDAIVVDAGAHAGQFTKIFARLARRGRVYAFEPSGYACSILRRTCALRGLRNVTVVPHGLGALAGRFELAVPLKRSGSLGFGASYVRAAAEQADEPTSAVTETIEVETLDGFAEAHGLPALSFIKADIEGWELRMLEGARAVLGRHRPVLMLEVSDRLLRRAGGDSPAVFEFLAEHGYAWRRIVGYEGKARGRIRLSDEREDGNFFCFPAERLEQTLARLPPA